MSSLLLLVSLLLVNYVAALPFALESSISVSNIKRSVTGPAIAANFPDPCVIKVNSTWYAFATRTKGTTEHVQVASSSDFTTWTVWENSDGTPYNALPNLPAWVDTSSSTSNNVWAPDVSQLDDGTFVMYYSATAASSSSGKHCVGGATASNVTGPYTAQANFMFCNLTAGGAIDPAGFRDHDGQRYVVYKVDGNAIGHVSAFSHP